MTSRSILFESGRLENPFEAYQWMIAIPLGLALLCALLSFPLLAGGNPIVGDVVFIIKDASAGQRNELCRQLRTTRSWVPGIKFWMQSTSGAPFCNADETAAPSTAVNITINVTKCNGAATAYIRNQERFIEICSDAIAPDTLIHEYFHHKLGHVGLQRTYLVYLAAEMRLTVEIPVRAGFQFRYTILFVIFSFAAFLQRKRLYRITRQVASWLRIQIARLIRLAGHSVTLSGAGL